MNYPLISEYIEAIKNAEDNFEQLKNLRPVLGEDGEPVFTSGNFAVVFKMRDEQTGKQHAVKCFLREQEGRAEAYRMIAEELEYVSSTYLTPIKYLDKELFVDTNSGDETEFPVLLMDWVEGETLDKYIVHNKYDGYKLSCLYRNFHELSKWLLSQPFAHGDLKPDNIIVRNECSLVLIDYDGMFVPKMNGQKARELGTPNYRNPYTEDLDNMFSKRIDDFAIIHILLSLRIYSIYPRLITKDKEFAIFTYEEFHNISGTSTYQVILSKCIDRKTSLLMMLFQKIISFGKISNEDWELLCFDDSERTFTNMGEMMCSLDNIVLAVNLAYSSMLYKDPARNEYSLYHYKELKDRINLALEIQKSLKEHDGNHPPFTYLKYSCLRPNGVEYREGVALDLRNYALRYLFGIVKYLSINKCTPTNIFGGGEDVFTPNLDENKYEVYLDRFVNVLEENAKIYKYLYVFDIRNFFKSIDLNKLKDIYFENDFTNVEWYETEFGWTLEKCSVQGLNPCSEVDFFFANLYLKQLDVTMQNYAEIKYYRYCDDIRIFSDNGSIEDILEQRITSVLSVLSLQVNKKKTKLIDTNNEKIELAKACFVWSCKLYMSINDSQSLLLNGKELAEIIDNDLTTTYIFKLLKEINGRAVQANGSLDCQIDNLFYILRNVHKNATLYRVVSELIFEIGVDSQEDPMLFSLILNRIVDVLKDEDVEKFVKYWVLRTFFCSDRQYYKLYRNEESKWKDQTWYPQPCYISQITVLLDRKFRKIGYDPLLYHLSHFILNFKNPNFTANDDGKDDLPF